MLLPAPDGGSYLNLQNEGPHIPPQAQICLQREARRPFGLLDSKSSIATPPPGLLHTGTHLGGCKPVPQNCDGRANPAPASAAWQLQGCTCRGEQTSNPGLTNHTAAQSRVANPTRFGVFLFVFFLPLHRKGHCSPPEAKVPSFLPLLIPS